MLNIRVCFFFWSSSLTVRKLGLRLRKCSSSLTLINMSKTIFAFALVFFFWVGGDMGVEYALEITPQ